MMMMIEECLYLFVEKIERFGKFFLCILNNFTQLFLQFLDHDAKYPECCQRNLKCSGFFATKKSQMFRVLRWPLCAWFDPLSQSAACICLLVHPHMGNQVKYQLSYVWSYSNWNWVRVKYYSNLKQTFGEAGYILIFTSIHHFIFILIFLSIFTSQVILDRFMFKFRFIDFGFLKSLSKFDTKSN